MNLSPPPQPSAAIVGLEQVREQAEALLDGVEAGEPLDALTASLIGLAVRAAVTTLDSEGTREFARRALAAGATPAQLSEVLMLIAGLGVHTLMEGVRDLEAVLEERGEAERGPLEGERAELWREHVGADPYWESFELQVPGFLDALVQQSPESFAAFFALCQVPWRMGNVPARTKELIALATDSMPSHRYLPGVRIHTLGALKAGALGTAIREAIEIGAATPAPEGVS